MQSLNTKTYLLYALYIVRTNPSILFLLAIIGLLNGATVYLPEGSINTFVSGITLIATIFISPVIYGIYYEVIEECYSSVVQIFRTYVAGYLLLLFFMYVPIIMSTAMITSAAGSEGNAAVIMLTILLFSMLFIYVIPSYFISGTIIESVSYGVQFFIRNLFASAPLLFMALSSELLLLLSHYQMGWLKGKNIHLFVMLDFTLYMTASVIDFLLFIILIYILRNQPDIKKRKSS